MNFRQLRSQGYVPIPRIDANATTTTTTTTTTKDDPRARLRSLLLTTIVLGLATCAVIWLFLRATSDSIMRPLLPIAGSQSDTTSGSTWRLSELGCDSKSHGVACQPHISHFWGQYSPYFSVPSDISPDVPPHCHLTFVQILSRHGARSPTANRLEEYRATVTKIQSRVKEFPDRYRFLKDYRLDLGSDSLTKFGEQQLWSSGLKFYARYRALTRQATPFVRTTSQERMMASAKFWNRGYASAKEADHLADRVPGAGPTLDVVIPELDYGENNTLHHDLCTAFENGTVGDIGEEKKMKWANAFMEPIIASLNEQMVDADLSITDGISLMELCPFDTVADKNGNISPFCHLFTDKEWRQYDYYGSLSKWYGYGAGNPLGPTQGIGFVNELIARLTNTSVNPIGSTNTTLDSNPASFPINNTLYADFSHDNDMTSIFFALGLYNDTTDLPVDSIVSPDAAKGYSAAWTVPFAARAYVEKMRCSGGDDDVNTNEEWVRVLVNDRVVPLTGCENDKWGKCGLEAFVQSLSFARSGGNWDRCFIE